MRPIRRLPLDWLSWEDVALHLAGDPHRSRILDFGCGHGVLLSRIRPDNLRVGVDVMSEALRRCRSRCGSRVCLVLTAPDADLPFRDGCFDAVITTEVIEHVPDDRRTIRELARVLVPGGLLILSTPHRHWLSFLDLGNLKFRFPRLHRFLLTRLGRVSDAVFEERYGGRGGLIGDVSVQADPWHRHYSLPQLKGLLADLFRIERYYVFGPLARLLWPAGTAAERLAPPLGRWLKQADHASRRHFSSQGFDICILARRCPEGESA